MIGFGASMVAAVVAAGIQSRLPWGRGAGSLEHPLAHGLRLGFGAMLGDTIKSFLVVVNHVAHYLGIRDTRCDLRAPERGQAAGGSLGHEERRRTLSVQ